MNTDQLDDLIPVEGEALPAEPSYDLEALNAFGLVLAGKRKVAMAARASSGVEDEWQEDEDAYEGVDDANRPERESKPQGINGSSNARRPSTSTKSTVFVPVTQQFVDFAAARAADILLPTDDRGFTIEPTPMPDVEELVEAKDATPIAPDGTTAADGGKQMLEALKKGAEKAQRRIDDWLAECQYNSHAREVLKDAAKIGTGVLKGPFTHVSRSTRSTRDDTGTAVVTIVENIQPSSKRISAWDLFPDYPACGENIHQGSFIFERDRMAKRGIEDLKNVPGYITEAIDIVLKEGPSKQYTEGGKQPSESDQFEVWYYHGFVTVDDLKAAGEPTDGLEETDSIPVMVSMVNDRVIRMIEAPLESGCFPYDVMCWSKRVGHWAGIGVGRQMRTPQRIINAATRAMLDNAGRSSAPQIVVDRTLIEPADGNWTITPGKVWWTTDEVQGQDVSKAFISIDIPGNQVDLQNIINYALEMAERVTGLPMLAQGQQGAATQTVGGMTLLDRNSNTPLRMTAKNFDDMITVPHIQRYYEYVLLHGPEDDEKANFKVIARGSSVLFEKDAQAQALMAMGQFVINPAFGKSPKLWIDEVMRSQRLDPVKLDLTPEEKEQLQKMQEAAAQQGDPRLEAAKIAAQASIERANIAAQVTVEKTKIDTDRDLVFVQAQTARDETLAEAKRQELILKRELAMLEYSNREKVSLDQIKKDLAINAMKLQVQKELSGADGKGPQVATPPTEPQGRADPGQAFQE